MSPKILFALLWCAAFSFARVITYTATDRASAEDADRAAMAGIAMQIRASVTAVRSTEKVGQTENGETELRTNYAERIDVGSDVTLEGVELKRQKKPDGSWESVATFDTEKATARARDEIRKIQKSALDVKSELEKFVRRGDFSSAGNALDSLDRLFAAGQKLYDAVSVFEPLDETYRMKNDAPIFRKKISDAVRCVRLSLVKKELPSGENGERLNAEVLVQNGNVPFGNVPVTATVDGKTFGRATSDSSGIAKFSFSAKSLLPGMHQVEFRMLLPKAFAGDFQNGLVLEYVSEVPACRVKLLCTERADVCVSGEEVLRQAGFQNVPDGEPLKFSIKRLSKKMFESSARPIARMEFLVELAGGSAHFSKKIKGVGTSEADALNDALEKVRAEDVQRSLHLLCTEK